MKVPVFEMRNSQKDTDFLSTVLREALEEIHCDVTFHDKETLGTDWIKKGLDDHLYALRTVGVDRGEEPQNWLLELMFTSRLGVSFPDAHHHMSEVIKNFREGQYSSLAQYKKSIHEALEESSCVVPVLETSHYWLVSSNFDCSTLDDLSIPRVWELRLSSNKKGA